MASDDPKAEGLTSRPVRTPPTLDLKAEDVTQVQAHAANPTAPKDTPPEDVTAVQETPNEAVGDAARSTDQIAQEAVGPEAEPASSLPPPPAKSGGALAGLLAGAVAGGVVAGGLWYGLPLLFPPAAPTAVAHVKPVNLAPIQDRLSVLEARPTVDPNAIAALGARLERSEAALKALEATVAGLKVPSAAPAAAAVPPALAATVDQLKTASEAGRAAQAATAREVETLRTAHASLETAVATASASAQQAGAQGQTLNAQLQALGTRLDAVGPRLDVLKKQIEDTAAAGTAFNRAAAGLVVLSTFRDAVVSGRPFATELAAARTTLGPAAAQLDPFAGAAAQGFAPPARLAATLAQEGAAALGTNAPKPDAASASLFDRLKASAEGLVKIRPATGPGSQDEDGVLGTAVTQVRAGQLEEALRTLGRLPPDVRSRIAVIRDIEARASAVRAAAALYQQQLAAISGKVP